MLTCHSKSEIAVVVFVTDQAHTLVIILLEYIFSEGVWQFCITSVIDISTHLLTVAFCSLSFLVGKRPAVAEHVQADKGTVAKVLLRPERRLLLTSTTIRPKPAATFHLII